MTISIPVMSYNKRVGRRKLISFEPSLLRQDPNVYRFHFDILGSLHNRFKKISRLNEKVEKVVWRLKLYEIIIPAFKSCEDEKYFLIF